MQEFWTTVNCIPYKNESINLQLQNENRTKNVVIQSRTVSNWQWQHIDVTIFFVQCISPCTDYHPNLQTLPNKTSKQTLISRTSQNLDDVVFPKKKKKNRKNSLMAVYKKTVNTNESRWIFSTISWLRSVSNQSASNLNPRLFRFSFPRYRMKSSLYSFPFPPPSYPSWQFFLFFSCSPYDNPPRFSGNGHVNHACPMFATLAMDCLRSDRW